MGPYHTCTIYNKSIIWHLLQSLKCVCVCLCVRAQLKIAVRDNRLFSYCLERYAYQPTRVKLLEL